MRTIGIEGNSTWAFATSIEGAAASEPRFLRTTFDILEFIGDLQNDVDLVLVQDRQGNEPNALINHLVPTLAELRLPFVKVSPQATCPFTFGWTISDSTRQFLPNMAERFLDGFSKFLIVLLRPSPLLASIRAGGPASSLH